MIDITTLKKGDKFYLFDPNYICYENTIIECEVMVRYYKTKKYMEIKAIKHVYPCKEQLVRFENDEVFYNELKLKAEIHMFNIDNFKEACEYCDEYIRLYKLGMYVSRGDAFIEDFYEEGKDYEQRYKERYKDYPDCFEDEDELNRNSIKCNLCDYKDECEEKIYNYYSRIGAEVLSQIDGLD